VTKSFIGLGYHATITSGDSAEHPGEPRLVPVPTGEIAQGRLEALLNFQTMVAVSPVFRCERVASRQATMAAGDNSLGIVPRPSPIGTSSLKTSPPDHRRRRNTRRPRGQVVVGRRIRRLDSGKFFGLLSLSVTDGRIRSYGDHRSCEVGDRRHSGDGPLALAPATTRLGGDIAIGNSQRFGVPMGRRTSRRFLATRRYARKMPGIVGVSEGRQEGRVPAHLQRASSPSAATRRRATSAPPRCCSRSWRACTPSTTAPRA
jgi:glycine dehydrogenase